RKVWRGFNRLTKVYEILAWAMEDLIARAPIPWRGRAPEDVWRDVNVVFQKLLDDRSAAAEALSQGFPPGGADGWMPQEQLTRFHDALGVLSGAMSDDIAGRGSTTPIATLENLFARTRGFELALLETIRDPSDDVRLAYETFEALDACLFPLELMGGL